MLEYFNLSGLMITNDDLEVIGSSCPFIHTLLLHNSNLISNDIVFARHFPRLKKLHLSNLLCLTTIDNIADGCSDLTELSVQGCQNLVSPSVEKVIGIMNLETLNIHSCKRVTFQSAQRIVAECCALRTLILGSNKITSDEYREIATLRTDCKVVFKNVSKFDNK